MTNIFFSSFFLSLTWRYLTLMTPVPFYGLSNALQPVLGADGGDRAIKSNTSWPIPHSGIGVIALASRTDWGLEDGYCVCVGWVCFCSLFELFFFPFSFLIFRCLFLPFVCFILSHFLSSLKIYICISLLHFISSFFFSSYFFFPFPLSHVYPFSSPHFFFTLLLRIFLLGHKCVSETRK